MLALLKKYNNRENGFTLIELLIVVLIIGILAAVSIPVYLGIQNQAHKSAVKADVNVAVKQVQVALTEGQPISALYGTKSGSDKGETLQIKASTTTGASANDFMVIGTDSTTATPASAVNYTYSYDSFTGQFTDSDSGTAFGGGNQANVAPSITSANPPATASVGTAYNFTVTASGTPTPTFSATGLPTGLSIQAATGVISGTPTATGTFNYTITAQNGTTPNGTQSGSIVVSAPGSLGTYTYTYEDGTSQGWGANSGTSMAVASNVNAHTKALSISGYLTNTYNNIVGAYVDPVGLPAYFTTGHTYKITYSYYMTSANSGGGGYITNLNMTAGQGNSYVGSSSIVYGAWTTVTTTWTQTTANQPFELKFYAGGYNGATVGMYIDDVTIQSTN